jgi:hypothetical protein
VGDNVDGKVLLVIGLDFAVSIYMILDFRKNVKKFPGEYS